MDNLRNILKKINTDSEIRFDEPMKEHTSFRTGGKADIFIIPGNKEELRRILGKLRRSGISEDRIFILGGGANLLVSDSGIRGAVIDLTEINSITVSGEGVLTAEAGASVDAAAEAALEAGFSGFDNFFGMPGTVGGAVWMNARCYGRSVSDIIRSVRYIDEETETRSMDAGELSFDYKKSPFQIMNAVITEAVFQLEKDVPSDIRKRMDEYRKDREQKGHYTAPCAGSVFKNNRDFGKPSGMIIDSLGLRGLSVGNAAVSDTHANIIINRGGAASSDIYRLVKLVGQKVYDAYGFRLEPEIRLVGEFPDS